MVDDKTLSQYGITYPVLLIVEMTEESYVNEEEWITEITELVRLNNSKCALDYSYMQCINVKIATFNWLHGLPCIHTTYFWIMHLFLTLLRKYN